MAQENNFELMRRWYEKAWINLALVILIAMNLVQGVLMVILVIRMNDLRHHLVDMTNRMRIVEDIIVDTAKERREEIEKKR